MDNRLKLTRKQKGLVERLRKLFYELKKENIGVLAEFSDYEFDGLIFYNASEVYDRDDFDCDDYDGVVTEKYIEESVNETADEDTIWYIPDPRAVERLTLYPFVDNSMSFENNWFSVLLDRDERVDEFYRRKAKQEKLAPLLDKMNKLTKKLEVYEQALISGEDSVKKLEFKNAKQEIIDEEYAQIASNKTRISEFQKEISELSKEIRKVKAIKIKKRKNGHIEVGKSGYSFHEGLAIIKGDNGKFGYIDKMGKIVIPCIWKDAKPFSFGMAVVMGDNGLYGYIGRNGDVIIPCEWKYAMNFLNDHGTRVTDVNGKNLAIDKTGKIYPKGIPRFVILNDGESFIDENGHYEDYVDEETGEVISIWVEDPDSGK